MSGRRHDVRLTAQAIKFAKFRAQGLNQTEAWRATFPDSQQIGTDNEWAAASRFANKPIVKAKVQEILQNASLAAQITSTRYIAETQDLRDWAVTIGNANAAMAAQRLIGQAGAILKDSGTLTVEHRSLAEKHVEELKRLGIPAEVADALLPRTSFGTKH